MSTSTLLLTGAGTACLAVDAGDGHPAWIRREIWRGGVAVATLVALASWLETRGREDLAAGAMAAAGMAGAAIAIDALTAVALEARGGRPRAGMLVLVASRAMIPGTAGFAALWAALAALAPAVATGHGLERILALTAGMALVVGQSRALGRAGLDDLLDLASGGGAARGHERLTYGPVRASAGFGVSAAPAALALVSIAIGLAPGALFGPLARATGSFPAPGPLALPGWTTWSTMPLMPVAIAVGLGLTLAWWTHPRGSRRVASWEPPASPRGGA